VSFTHNVLCKEAKVDGSSTLILLSNINQVFETPKLLLIQAWQQV
jgi:hypothetical protein